MAASGARTEAARSSATDVATGATSIFNGFPPDSGAGDITLGPDGAIWFTDFNNRIGRMTTAGVVT